MFPQGVGYLLVLLSQNMKTGSRCVLVSTGNETIEQRVPHRLWHSEEQKCTLHPLYRESKRVYGVTCHKVARYSRATVASLLPIPLFALTLPLRLEAVANALLGVLNVDLLLFRILHLQ
jgi:hypothetical protein